MNGANFSKIDACHEALIESKVVSAVAASKNSLHTLRVTPLVALEPSIKLFLVVLNSAFSVLKEGGVGVGFRRMVCVAKVVQILTTVLLQHFNLLRSIHARVARQVSG